MKKSILLALFALSCPLLAQEGFEDYDFNDPEDSYAEEQPQYQAGRECYRCPTYYYYFDFNWDYNEERDQDAYWPGKKTDTFYDFLTR